MALKKCVECGVDINVSVKSCPQCGTKQKKKTSTGMVILAVCMGFGFLSFLAGNGEVDVNSGYAEKKSKPKPNKAEVLMHLATEQIKHNAIQKDSIEIRSHIFVNKSKYGAAACGEVNGKNSFGGFTGWKKFVITELSPQVIIDSSHKDADKFAQLWNNACFEKEETPVKAN